MASPQSRSNHSKTNNRSGVHSSPGMISIPRVDFISQIITKINNLTNELPNDLSAVEPYYIVPLVEIRNELDQAKNLQDPFYTDGNLRQDWERFTIQRDLYKGQYFSNELRRYGFSIISNAALKFYEIWRRYLPLDGKFGLKAFFNAELPGAGLAAWLKYTEKYARDRNWLASSLMFSADNTALGDNYKLFANNREKWLMDSDVPAEKRNERSRQLPGGAYNGDMSVAENVLYLESVVGPQSEFGGVELYSHDAGIGVDQAANGDLEFNKQEELNFHIHLGCLLAGMLTLLPGGMMVGKLYTTFQSQTINVLLILMDSFDTVEEIKLTTSRPNNSEIYVVCRGFKSLAPVFRNIMLNRLRNPRAGDVPLFPLTDNMRPAVADMILFAQKVYLRQAEIIKSNVKLFATDAENIRRVIGPLKHSAQTNWLYENIQGYVPLQNNNSFTNQKSYGRSHQSSHQRLHQRSYRGNASKPF